jgi:hypothetical protein
MKFAYVLPAVLLFASSSFAETRIWRCGNTYTNDTAEAQSRGCKVVEGGNVTVVGTRVSAQPREVKVAAAPQAVSTPTPQPVRIDAGEQRTRDTEARAILEAELKKAEARLAELQKEWNNGEPEKLGPEHRNHQKYIDRVAELKASIARTESDIAGLRRELGRGAGSAAK